jgi:hypothetical protein
MKNFHRQLNYLLHWVFPHAKQRRVSSYLHLSLNRVSFFYPGSSFSRAVRSPTPIFPSSLVGLSLSGARSTKLPFPSAHRETTVTRRMRGVARLNRGSLKSCSTLVLWKLVGNMRRETLGSPLSSLLPCVEPGNVLPCFLAVWALFVPAAEPRALRSWLLPWLLVYGAPCWPLVHWYQSVPVRRGLLLIYYCAALFGSGRY